jgi:hypothetical protein
LRSRIFGGDALAEQFNAPIAIDSERRVVFLLLAGTLPLASAQVRGGSAATPVKGKSETMVVLGTATPVPLAESQRSVEILPVKGEVAGRRVAAGSFCVRIPRYFSKNAARAAGRLTWCCAAEALSRRWCC